MGFIDRLKSVFTKTTKNAGRILGVVGTRSMVSEPIGSLTKAQKVASYKGAVHSAVKRIADQVAMTDFRILKKTKGGMEELPLDHPAVRLFENPNPEMDRFELMERLSISYDLLGDAFWYLHPSPQPTEIWPLLGHLVSVVPEKDPQAGRLVKGYIYSKTGLLFNGATDKSATAFGVNEVVHFRAPNPRSMLNGFSPIEAMESAIQLDDELAKQRVSLAQNDSIPPAILTTQQPLGPKDAEKLREQWEKLHGGRGNKGRIAVLEGAQWDVHRLGLGPDEVQWNESKQKLWQEVFSGFRVPWSIQGGPEVNKASVEAGERLITTGAVKPRLMRFEAAINKWVMPRFGEGIVFKFDDPTTKDSSFRLTEKELNLRTGYSTVNEERDRDGLPSVSWGAVPWLQLGMAQVGTAGREQIRELAMKDQEGFSKWLDTLDSDALKSLEDKLHPKG